MRFWLLLTVAVALEARADSPLTSIDFTPAYADLTVVRDAKRHPRLKPAATQFLLSDAPSDQKAAVVNALGWESNGNAQVFLTALLQRHHSETIELEALSASEAFVLGYLEAMEDYLELKPLAAKGAGVRGRTPLELLDFAAQGLPDDFAVQFVRALVQAQKTMRREDQWCEVFKGPHRVLEQFPPPRRNLKPGAVEAAVGYLSGYEESCPASTVAISKKREELNQLYAVAKLGTQIVVGTQGGIVVWQPGSRTPVAIQEEFICGHVVIWEGAAWAGCDQQVFRWDGKTFKSYLGNKAKDAEYYAPMLGTDGKLWVRYGAKTFAFNRSTDRFEAFRAPWQAGPYDALVTRTGVVWWIDFLKAVHAGPKTFRLQSAEYPGRDPRRIREDPTGALWVEDFESGLFRLNSEGTFVKDPLIDSQVTGVAVDLNQERLFALHYRNGLTIRPSGRTVQTVELKELDYMRDLLLTPEGELWIAGWTRLLRLREEHGAWTKESYRIEP